jgi:2-methylcitrate dehydratase PrpD
MESTSTIAEQFARWAVGVTFDDLPEGVVIEARNAISDIVSLMVLGSTVERVAPYRALVAENPLAGSATIARDAGLFAPAAAAFVNAIYAHSSEYDDIYLEAGGHPGVAVIPAALAVAEQRRLSGRQLIAAVAVGYEVMHRSINPIFPYTQRRGFQGTGLAGPFGSAAAVGSLRNTDAAILAHAFGIAGCYSSGLMEYDQSGGESKRLYAGLAARAGIESVELAMAGISGPLTIFEGRRGVFNAFADERHPERATAGLGSGFRIATHRHVKPYPVVTSIHGALDALRVLVPLPLDPGDIDSITIVVPPLAVSHGGAIGVPKDTLSAQFSFAFSVAVWVLTGSTDMRWFEDDAFRRSEQVAALCSKVVLRPDPRLEADAQQGGATVEIVFADGRKSINESPIPSGRPDNPLSEEQRIERFSGFTEPGLGTKRSAALFDALQSLDSLDDAGEIMRAIAAPGADGHGKGSEK